jgi:hypothetical protein
VTSAPAGDRAVVSIAVGVTPEEAFRIFTEEIDQWWRHGMKYRLGRQRSVVHLECRSAGRLFESIGEAPRTRIVETGRIIVWEPPARFVLAWRAVNFAPEETTEVEVTFAAQGEGTLVRLEHRGWSRIRPDHPVRHGQDVTAFLRRQGLWWGDQLSSFRMLAEKRDAGG